MKVIICNDGVRWFAQTAEESEAIMALHDLIVFNTDIPVYMKDDFGCDCAGLYWYFTPLPLTARQRAIAAIAYNGSN